MIEQYFELYGTTSIGYYILMGIITLLLIPVVILLYLNIKFTIKGEVHITNCIFFSIIGFLYSLVMICFYFDENIKSKFTNLNEIKAIELIKKLDYPKEMANYLYDKFSLDHFKECENQVFLNKKKEQFINQF